MKVRWIGWTIVLLAVGAGATWGAYWYAEHGWEGVRALIGIAQKDGSQPASHEKEAGEKEPPEKGAASKPAGEGEGKEEAKPVAKVRVEPLRAETIDEILTAFGTVEAALGETRTFTVPFESRVWRVLVVGGQLVDANETLAEVDPAPTPCWRWIRPARNATGRRTNWRWSASGSI